MRLLLDTSYLYDFMDRPGRLLASERDLLHSRETRLHVSAVSIWEMRLKHNARHRSGERKSRFSPADVVATLEDQEVTFLPLTQHHAITVLDPPLGHKDPFDELLLVQAQVEGLRLLTKDGKLAQHPLALALGPSG